jgi:hypothetical protein
LIAITSAYSFRFGLLHTDAFITDSQIGRVYGDAITEVRGLIGLLAEANAKEVKPDANPAMA